MLGVAALLAIASLLAVVTQRLRIPLTLILVVVGFIADHLRRCERDRIRIPVEEAEDVGV